LAQAIENEFVQENCVMYVWNRGEKAQREVRWYLCLLFMEISLHSSF